jgi:hypothetical protein
VVIGDYQDLPVFIKDVSGNVVFIKEVPTVDKQIGLYIPGMVQDGQKIS